MKNVHFYNSEEALETLQLATEAACVGVWDLDVGTGVLSWSELTRKIFGVGTSGPFTLDDFTERVHPEDRERVSAAVAGALNAKESKEYDIEYRILRPDQEERFVGARGKAFFEGEDGQRKAVRFIGTLLDRTDQKRAQAALAQAEQLAATGRLAASIAHEINNPLEAVTNLLYLMREEADEETRREYLNSAESELARISEIASNTLRFYRDPKGPSRVGIKALLESVVSLFQGRITVRGVEVDLACEPRTEVVASQGELRQVLVNLIGNAIDAMPQGGKLRIHCQTFAHTIGRHKPGVGICVADTGSGMPPEVLHRAFEPFYTTKGNAGTGLGLWLTQEILRKHGFTMAVKSKPNCGTVFRIHIPLGSEAGSSE